MKKISFYFCWLAVISLFLVGCSKEDSVQNQNEISQEKAVITFSTMLNDLIANRNSQQKQVASDIPECSENSPAFVEIILSQDGVNVVGDDGNPLRIELNPTPADYDGDGVDNYFTKEASELELEPGTYTLEYFTVLDDAETVIWVAPKSGDSGSFANFVDNPLPFDIQLGAGVKKYVSVDVLCYDERMADEYGYLFFDITTNEANTFCIFGNYCDENGRHYSAHYSVNVWIYSGDSENPKGAVLYEDEMNTVGIYDNGDSYASPLCLVMPDNGEFYVEITLLNSNDYTTTEEVIRSGVISSDDIKGLYLDETTTSYYHFREGNCNLEDTPAFFDGENNGGNGGECNPNDPAADCDGDGVMNGDDACPNTPPGTDVQENGCENVQVPGRDVVVFNDINIFTNTALEDPDNVRLVQNLVTFTTGESRNNGTVVMIDRGRNARCLSDDACSDSELGTMRSTIEAAGFSITDLNSTSGSITNIPSDVKTIFLMMPTVSYTLAEINTFKNFAKDGGRIVFIGEWDGYYLDIPVENQFLLNMGAVLTNTGGAVDCGGYIVLPNASNRTHPIMDGIVDLTYGCASVIQPGAQDFPLFYDKANVNVLAGVAKIDVGLISVLKKANQEVSRSNIKIKPQNTLGKN